MLCIFIRIASNENPQYTIFNILKKISLNYPISAAIRILQGIQRRVRDSCGKRAISVPATEVLLQLRKQGRLNV